MKNYNFLNSRQKLSVIRYRSGLISKQRMLREIDEFEMDESAASEEAKKQGLKHIGFGRYADGSGKVVAVSKGGSLQPVKGSKSSGETPKTDEPKNDEPKNDEPKNDNSEKTAAVMDKLDTLNTTDQVTDWAKSASDEEVQLAADGHREQLKKDTEELTAALEGLRDSQDLDDVTAEYKDEVKEELKNIMNDPEKARKAVGAALRYLKSGQPTGDRGGDLLARGLANIKDPDRVKKLALKWDAADDVSAKVNIRRARYLNFKDSAAEAGKTLQGHD